MTTPLKKNSFENANKYYIDIATSLRFIEDIIYNLLSVKTEDLDDRLKFIDKDIRKNIKDKLIEHCSYKELIIMDSLSIDRFNSMFENDFTNIEKENIIKSILNLSGTNMDTPTLALIYHNFSKDYVNLAKKKFNSEEISRNGIKILELIDKIKEHAKKEYNEPYFTLDSYEDVYKEEYKTTNEVRKMGIFQKSTDSRVNSTVNGAKTQIKRQQIWVNVMKDFFKPNSITNIFRPYSPFTTKLNNNNIRYMDKYRRELKNTGNNANKPQNTENRNGQTQKPRQQNNENRNGQPQQPLQNTGNGNRNGNGNGNRNGNGNGNVKTEQNGGKMHNKKPAQKKKHADKKKPAQKKK